MKGSYFDKITGIGLHYGPTNNAVAQRLASEGHFFVEGVNWHSEQVKWDFGLGQLVPDTQWIDREQRVQDKKTRRREIWAELETLYGNIAAPAQQQQVALLSELARL